MPDIDRSEISWEEVCAELSIGTINGRRLFCIMPMPVPTPEDEKEIVIWYLPMPESPKQSEHIVGKGDAKIKANELLDNFMDDIFSL